MGHVERPTDVDQLGATDTVIPARAWPWQRQRQWQLNGNGDGEAVQRGAGSGSMARGPALRPKRRRHVTCESTRILIQFEDPWTGTGGEGREMERRQRIWDGGVKPNFRGPKGGQVRRVRLCGSGSLRLRLAQSSYADVGGAGAGSQVRISLTTSMTASASVRLNDGRCRRRRCR